LLFFLRILLLFFSFFSISGDGEEDDKRAAIGFLGKIRQYQKQLAKLQSVIGKVCDKIEAVQKSEAEKQTAAASSSASVCLLRRPSVLFTHCLLFFLSCVPFAVPPLACFAGTILVAARWWPPCWPSPRSSCCVSAPRHGQRSSSGSGSSAAAGTVATGRIRVGTGVAPISRFDWPSFPTHRVVVTNNRVLLFALSSLSSSLFSVSSAVVPFRVLLFVGVTGRWSKKLLTSLKKRRPRPKKPSEVDNFLERAQTAVSLNPLKIHLVDKLRKS